MRAHHSHIPRCHARYALFAFALACLPLAMASPSALAQPEDGVADDGAAGTSEETGAEKKQERKPSEEPVKIENADRIHIEQYDNREQRVLLLEGNVHLRQEDVDLFADVVRMEGDKTAEATGNLRVVDPENVIVGDLLTADFDEGRMTITGNVRLVHEEPEEEDEEKLAGDEPSEPGLAPSKAASGDGPGTDTKPSPETAQDNGQPKRPVDEKIKRTVVTCDRMHYYYDDKRAICMGNVVAKHEDETLYTHRAVYDENADTLTVPGDVRIEQADGSVFHFTGAVVNLEDDTIQAEGMTKSVLVREKKKGESSADKAPGAPAPRAEGADASAETGAARPGPVSPPAPDQDEPDAKARDSSS